MGTLCTVTGVVSLVRYRTGPPCVGTSFSGTGVVSVVRYGIGPPCVGTLYTDTGVVSLVRYRLEPPRVGTPFTGTGVGSLISGGFSQGVHTCTHTYTNTRGLFFFPRIGPHGRTRLEAYSSPQMRADSA